MSKNLSNLISNLSYEEGQALNDTVYLANIVFSREQNEQKALAKAVKFFKTEKASAKGKLKKVYAAFQKAENLRVALDVHFDIKVNGL